MLSYFNHYSFLFFILHSRTAGMGQAVLRLLQFRDQLSPGDQAQEMSFWNSFVEDFFTPNAIFKVTLWDNLQGKHTEFGMNVTCVCMNYLLHINALLYRYYSKFNC